LLSGKDRRSAPSDPEQVEGHIGRRRRAPQEIIELWPSGLVDRDHLAVDYRLVDLEYGCQLLGEHLEAAQDVAIA
jgi:hypothetical protein